MPCANGGCKYVSKYKNILKITYECSYSLKTMSWIFANNVAITLSYQNINQSDSNDIQQSESWRDIHEYS